MDVFKRLPEYLFFFVAIVAALFLVKIFDISYPLTITTTTRSGELAVVGEGKVEVVPDTAYVEAGIAVANVETVEKAQNSIDEINNKIIAAMKSLGIPTANIKTSNYSINPNYIYDEKERKIQGYNGNATVTIKVEDMKLVTQVINEATKAGANQVRGNRFTIDQPEKYREQARDKAIENARTQAESLAKKLGISLGKIVNIVESSAGNTYPMYYDAALLKAGGGEAGPVIEPGTQTVTSTVTLYFEKK